MKTGEGGYWIQFDNDEEEKEFYESAKRKANEMIGLLGGMMLIMAGDKNDNTIKQKTKKGN